jgi:hypothetical protein
LNFLEKSTHPEIAYAVHQCAQFVEAPTKLHGEAVKHIGRYLLKTRDKGIILKPTKSSFDCWAHLIVGLMLHMLENGVNMELRQKQILLLPNLE